MRLWLSMTRDHEPGYGRRRRKRKKSTKKCVDGLLFEFAADLAANEVDEDLAADEKDGT